MNIHRLHLNPLLTGIAAGTTLGILGSSVVPILIGAVMDGFGASSSQAGLIGVIEVGATPVAALLLSPFMARLPAFRIAFTGALLSIVCQFLSIFADSTLQLGMLRLAAGIGLGGAFAAANASAAGSRDAGSLYGGALAIALLVIGLAIVVLGYTTHAYGFRGTYATLGCLIALIMPALYSLRGANPDHRPRIRAPERKYCGRSPLLLFVTVILFNLGTGPIYSFVERVGNELGISMEMIGTYLGISTISGIIGALLSPWVLRRIRTSVSVGMAFLLCGMATLLIGMAWSGGSYFFGIALYWVTYCFLYAALLTIAAGIDATGRVSAAVGGINVLTFAFGPAIGGFIAQWSTYETIAWFGLLCCICGSACFLLNRSFWDRRTTVAG